MLWGECIVRGMASLLEFFYVPHASAGIFDSPIYHAITLSSNAPLFTCFFVCFSFVFISNIVEL